MNPLRLTREAECEYQAAIRWYERQRRGLGQRFRTAVKRELARIAAKPDYWPFELGSVRQAVMIRWPYAILYRSRTNFVEVISIFNAYRDPQEWMDRI